MENELSALTVILTDWLIQHRTNNGVRLWIWRSKVSRNNRPSHRPTDLL